MSDPATPVVLAESDEDTRIAVARALRRDGNEVLEAAVDVPWTADRAATTWLAVVAAGGSVGYEPIASARRGGAAAVIALVQPTETYDVAGALDFGADDALLKPPPLDELTARVRSVRRRARVSRSMSLGALTMVPERRAAAFAGDEVALTRREFDLLECLVRARANVVSRDHLLDRLWGYRGTGADASLNEHVRRLRNKLRRVGGDAVLTTVRGIGYRLDDADPSRARDGSDGGGDAVLRESHLHH